MNKKRLILGFLIVLVFSPVSDRAFTMGESISNSHQNEVDLKMIVNSLKSDSDLKSTSDDTVQNKAFAHLEIDSSNNAHITAGFKHPEDLTEEVMIEWFLYAWNDGSSSIDTLAQYIKVTGTNHIELNTTLTVPGYEFYLLRCKNKLKNEEGTWIPLFSSESRWSRKAPHNGIWERTGEVTSSSAILQTYLTEKPAFNATEETTLRVPPMAGYAQFAVYSDLNLQLEVAHSEWFPVDDYIQVGDEWRRINYNVRWTITDLTPDSTYYYLVATRSSDGSSESLAANVNSFKTAPLMESEDPIVFVVAHCLDAYNTAYPDDPVYEDLGLKVFASMLSDPPPDFIILQGDTVYYDGGDYSPDVGLYFGYEQKWLYWYAQYQFTNLMNFFQQVPGYWLVDDHDYWENNINEYKPDGWYIFRNANPTPGSYGTTGENAVSYYNQNQYLSSAGDGEKFWRSLRWGKHVEIFLEEGRNFRDYDAGLIWNTEQREWLEQKILESDATFKIISATTPLLGPVVADNIDLSIIPDKHASNYFRPETELFLNNIKDVKNVFILAGDRHYKYHSIINGTNYPELIDFQEFGSGSAAAPPHAVRGGTHDSDLATMIYSDVELGPSAGYMRIEINPIQNGAQIMFKLIRVTEELDNDLVYQYSYIVDFSQPSNIFTYLPFIMK